MTIKNMQQTILFLVLTAGSAVHSSDGYNFETDYTLLRRSLYEDTVRLSHLPPESEEAQFLRAHIDAARLLLRLGRGKKSCSSRLQRRAIIAAPEMRAVDVAAAHFFASLPSRPLPAPAGARSQLLTPEPPVPHRVFSERRRQSLHVIGIPAARSNDVLDGYSGSGYETE